MKERTRAIFDAAMRSFIATGKPVTSRQLFERCDFGIKPAMIRWELNALSRDGFFFQNHPSGGRFPTDKAYRAFIRDILQDQGDVEPTETREAKALCHDAAEGEWKDFVTEFAREFQMFSFGYEPARNRTFESGLSRLINRLDTVARDLLLEVVGDIENLPDRISEQYSRLIDEDEWPQVFIGSNPFTRSRHVAVVAERFNTDGGDFFLLTFGPKRMDYEKSLRMLRSIRIASSRNV